MKKLICLAVLLSCLNTTGQCGAGFAGGVMPATSMLIINNNRSCPVTVNYEVTDCIVNNYCNSLAQFITTPTFVIQPGTSFVVDIALQNNGSGGAGDCSFYTTSTSGYDVSVGLFQINGISPVSGGIYGRVSSGCGGNCFSTGNFAGGTMSPPSCPGAWLMLWSLAPAGVIVNIN